MTKKKKSSKKVRFVLVSYSWAWDLSWFETGSHCGPSWPGLYVERMALISEIHLISGINRMCHHVLIQVVFIVLFDVGVTMEPRLALSLESPQLPKYWKCWSRPPNLALF